MLQPPTDLPGVVLIQTPTGNLIKGPSESLPAQPDSSVRHTLSNAGLDSPVWTQSHLALWTCSADLPVTHSR